MESMEFETTSPLDSPNKAKVTTGGNLMLGFGFGIMVSMLCVIVGIFLCATVIGAPLGFCFFGGAILGPFFTPLLFSNIMIEGICPYCETKIKVTNGIGADCGACKKRIIIRDKIFHKIPNQ